MFLNGILQRESSYSLYFLALIPGLQLSSKSFGEIFGFARIKIHDFFIMYFEFINYNTIHIFALQSVGVHKRSPICLWNSSISIWKRLESKELVGLSVFLYFRQYFHVVFEVCVFYRETKTASPAAKHY